VFSDNSCDNVDLELFEPFRTLLDLELFSNFLKFQLISSNFATMPYTILSTSCVNSFLRPNKLASISFPCSRLTLPELQFEYLRKAFYLSHAVHRHLLMARSHIVQGSQTSNCRWRLSSIVVVCSTRIGLCNVTHQRQHATAGQ